MLAGMAAPFGAVQAGRFTRVSRGMETTVAAEWSWLTCTTMAVSERAVPSVAPPASAPLAPLRESEPSTSTLKEPLLGAEGRAVPSWESMSTLPMFEFHCQYA